MRLLESIKSFNPLSKLRPSAAARIAAGLQGGQTLADVLREASDSIAKTAVHEALDAFTDGPAALFITCLIESTTAGWERLASALVEANQLPREGSVWVGARMIAYGQSLHGDLMSQHLINVVLSVTGLHVEALLLDRKDIDARRLTEKLAELLKNGMSSGISRNDLAQSLVSSRPSRRISAPRPSAS